MKLPRVRVRVTSITTTSSLLLAGWILSSLYRRFHSSQSYARGEIRYCSSCAHCFGHHHPDCHLGPWFSGRSYAA